MKFTPEQLAKAKAAKSAEELLALAKENGIEMTEDEANKYYADFHKEGELADEELDNVSGGGDCTSYSDGIWGPNGNQHYAIVTTHNHCDGYQGDYLIPTCVTCKHSFTAGATLYCSIRTEENDPY